MVIEWIKNKSESQSGQEKEVSLTVYKNTP